jgi:hypothetical protein
MDADEERRGETVGVGVLNEAIAQSGGEKEWSHGGHGGGTVASVRESMWQRSSLIGQKIDFVRQDRLIVGLDHRTRPRCDETLCRDDTSPGFGVMPGL